jgi:hypothetical protein
MLTHRPGVWTEVDKQGKDRHRLFLNLADEFRTLCGNLTGPRMLEFTLSFFSTLRGITTLSY